MRGSWFGGIDVGATRLHAAAVDSTGRVLELATFPAGELVTLVRWTEGAAGVAVDAPDRWSTAPHGDDRGLAPKFRSARCGEIALGRDHGLWVPWTTPPEPAPGTWIDVGVRLFAALRAEGREPVEVYPHGAFRVLNGARRLPSKRTAAGRAARAHLLAAAGARGVPGDAPHDVLDALVAAVVALHRHAGRARAATCGHDGSAIWLPGGRSAPGVAEPSAGAL